MRVSSRKIGGPSGPLAHLQHFDTYGALRATDWVSYTGRLPREWDRQYGEDLRSGIRYTVLSYATPIGWVTTAGEVKIPDVSYSVTTSRHQSQVRAWMGYAVPKPAEHITQAQKIGSEHGRNAADWWRQDAIGGRVWGDGQRMARDVLQGLEDGDPAVLDSLPGPDLSGQFADGYSSRDLLRDLGVKDGDASFWEGLTDELFTAYETSYSNAVSDAVEGYCRQALGVYPHTVDGRTVWACCVSSIGPVCGHRSDHNAV
jgi:hypothetical protein